MEPASSRPIISGLLQNASCRVVALSPEVLKTDLQPWFAVYTRLCMDQSLLTSEVSLTPCVKVLLLGHGAAGKTSILKSLRRLVNRGTDGPSRTEQSTVGLEVQSITDRNVEFSVWDFAGQLEYLSTHQHFFSRSNAIYVVVVDASKPLDLQRANVRTWLAVLAGKMGKLRGNESIRVILVGNKIDLLQDRFTPEIASRPLIAAMREFDLPYHSNPKGLVTFVSAMTELGMKEIRALLHSIGQELVQTQVRSPCSIPYAFFSVMTNRTLALIARSLREPLRRSVSASTSRKTTP